MAKFGGTCEKNVVFSTKTLAEFHTVHIVGGENASRFFSGASVKICHIPVKFFMTIAKIFHNPSKVSYVDLSTKNLSVSVPV